MKSFDIRTKIFFGDNALDRILELRYKKIMVITDPFIAKSPLLPQVTERLQQAYIDFSIFSDVVPDPPLDKISAGVKKGDKVGNYDRVTLEEHLNDLFVIHIHNLINEVHTPVKHHTATLCL